MGIKISRIVAIDVETTGFSKGSDPSIRNQILSIGLVIADSNFRELDSFYTEIKFDPNIAIWSKEAEAIHGMSIEYLEQNGVTEEDAVCDILEFLVAHFDIINGAPLYVLGHNVRNFDIPFLLAMMNRHGVNLKIAHRTIDSFSAGFVAFGAENSNELFEIAGCVRAEHNALEDARMSLKSCRLIRKLFKSIAENSE